jgi:predicted homoserine dehydrogenase-like protein
MKKDYKKAVDEVKENAVEKTDEERMVDAIEALKAQVHHHNTMLIKAQGALEVLIALTEEAK